MYIKIPRDGLAEDGAGLPSGSSEKGVQRDSGRGARPPCQPRGRVWSQCMPFLLDPVSPRSPWHPAAGRLAPASGQPRTGGGAASGALGGAAARALHALGPRSGRRRDAGRVWASGGALPCTPAFTPAARGRRGPGGRGRRGAGCARGGRVWWAAAAACGPCTRAARGPSSQGPARAVPSVPSVGRVAPAGRWGQRPARRASLCAHCGRRRPPAQAPRNTFVFLLGRERKRQTLPGGWAFGWLDI